MTDGYYRCDRCDAFERGPIQKNWTSNRDFADEDYRRIKYGHLKGEDDSGSISKTVDLCHDCRKELTEWLNSEDDE